MTAAVALKRVDLVDVFIARDGLIERVGADALQQILSDAFRPYREGGP